MNRDQVIWNADPLVDELSREPLLDDDDIVGMSIGDFGKGFLGVNHMIGKPLLSAFGLGSVANSVEQLEMEHGALPDWAVTPTAQVGGSDYVVIVRTNNPPLVIASPAKTAVYSGKHFDGNGYTPGLQVGTSFSFGVNKPIRVDVTGQNGKKVSFTDADQVLFMGGNDSTPAPAPPSGASGGGGGAGAGNGSGGGLVSAAAGAGGGGGMGGYGGLASGLGGALQGGLSKIAGLDNEGSLEMSDDMEIDEILGELGYANSEDGYTEVLGEDGYTEIVGASPHTPSLQALHNDAMIVQRAAAAMASQPSLEAANYNAQAAQDLLTALQNVKSASVLDLAAAHAAQALALAADMQGIGAGQHGAGALNPSAVSSNTQTATAVVNAVNSYIATIQNAMHTRVKGNESGSWTEIVGADSYSHGTAIVGAVLPKGVSSKVLPKIPVQRAGIVIKSSPITGRKFTSMVATKKGLTHAQSIANARDIGKRAVDVAGKVKDSMKKAAAEKKTKVKGDDYGDDEILGVLPQGAGAQLHAAVHRKNVKPISIALINKAADTAAKYGKLAMTSADKHEKYMATAIPKASKFDVNAAPGTKVKGLDEILGMVEYEVLGDALSDPSDPNRPGYTTSGQIDPPDPLSPGYLTGGGVDPNYTGAASGTDASGVAGPPSYGLTLPTAATMTALLDYDPDPGIKNELGVFYSSDPADGGTPLPNGAIPCTFNVGYKDRDLGSWGLYYSSRYYGFCLNVGGWKGGGVSHGRGSTSWMVFRGSGHKDTVASSESTDLGNWNRDLKMMTIGPRGSMKQPGQSWGPLVGNPGGGYPNLRLDVSTQTWFFYYDTAPSWAQAPILAAKLKQSVLDYQTQLAAAAADYATQAAQDKLDAETAAQQAKQQAAADALTAHDQAQQQQAAVAQAAVQATQDQTTDAENTMQQNQYNMQQQAQADIQAKLYAAQSDADAKNYAAQAQAQQAQQEALLNFAAAHPDLAPGILPGISANIAQSNQQYDGSQDDGSQDDGSGMPASDDRNAEPSSYDGRSDATTDELQQDGGSPEADESAAMAAEIDSE